MSIEVNLHELGSDPNQRWARAYTFPLHGAAQMRYIPIVMKMRTDGAEYDDVYLGNSWSSRSFGVGGCENVRIAPTGPTEVDWVYFTIFFRVPVVPGARANRSLRPVNDCPAFSGELIVVRRTSNAQHVLNMHHRDRRKAEAAVASFVRSVVDTTTDQGQGRRQYSIQRLEAM